MILFKLFYDISSKINSAHNLLAQTLLLINPKKIMQYTKFSITILFALTCLLSKAQNLVSAQKIALSNNQFGLDIFNEIIKEKQENTFISPYSISTAFAMAYAGSSGKTQKAIQSVLKFDAESDSFHQAYAAYLSAIEMNAQNKLTLNGANAIWVEKSVKMLPQFSLKTQRYYGAEAPKLDFFHNPEASRQTINQWVANKTANKIKDLLPSGAINNETRMVLTNAIYFKADWHRAFSKESTQEKRFNINNETHITTPFLKQEQMVRYLINQDYAAIELPYKGQKHSMIIVLPHPNKDIKEVSKQLKPDFLQQIMQQGLTDVHCEIPKFKTTIPISLKKPLKAMGLEDAFSDNANFNQMIEKDRLKISDVLHKAFIEIDETGTEAAAATAIVMMTTSSANFERKQPTYFIANRPFLFYIVDNSLGSILFMGSMHNPKS